VSWAAHAPQAAPGSALAAYVSDQDRRQHLIFVGMDAHVHELWWSFAQPGWHATDVSAAAGALNAAPGTGLAAYVSDQDGHQHLIFVGTDAQVHELWWNLNPLLPPDIRSFTSNYNDGNGISSNPLPSGEAATLYWDVVPNPNIVGLNPPCGVSIKGVDNTGQQVYSYTASNLVGSQLVTLVAGRGVPNNGNQYFVEFNFVAWCDAQANQTTNGAHGTTWTIRVDRPPQPTTPSVPSAPPTGPFLVCHPPG
jgi:hypothetical protein